MRLLSSCTRLNKNLGNTFVFILLILQVSVTQAQNPQESSATTGGAEFSLAPVIVTATRTPTSTENVLADYIFISHDEILQAGQSSLTEVLQQQRGVEISSYGGSGNFSNVSLRGTSGSESILLVDGVRVESSSVGGGILNLIPLALVDHIEIIYGAQSTLYGSNALGGVIQVFTKQGGGPTQFSASSGYGSYGTTINTVASSGAIDGNNKTKYSIGITQEHSLGYNTVASNNYCSPTNGNGCNYPTTDTGYMRVGVTAQIAQEWANHQELAVKVFSSSNQYQYPDNDSSSGNYPGNQFPYSSYPVTTGFLGTGVNKYTNVTIFSKNQFTENWDSNIKVTRVINFAQNLWPNAGYVGSNDSTQMPETDFSWQNSFKLGDDLLQVIAESRAQSIYGVYSMDQSWACNCSISHDRTTHSLIGSYQIKRGDNLATLSVRDDSVSDYDSRVTGGVAYGYMLTSQWRSNMSYSTGYRVPTYQDLYYPGAGNPNLVPESSRNMELGLSYVGQVFNSRVVAYQNVIKNFIEPYYSPGNPLSYPINLGSVRIRGVSYEASGKVGALNLKGSVDYLQAMDQNTNLELPRRAKFAGNASADYKVGAVDVGANVVYSGQTYDTLSNNPTNINNPYTLLNVFTSYKLDSRWSIFARVNNVFNTQYQTIYGYAMPGANVFAGIRYDIK
jgi:vitamin B12 transporter